MDKLDVSEEILRGSQDAGKSYDFDEAHDELKPAQWWFQQSQEGLVLFIVFYSQACRWSRCLGCSLPSKMSKRHVPYRSLIAQIDHLMGHPQVVPVLPEIRKVIMSNNGSILDQVTFSSSALMYFLVQLNMRMPNVATLTLETRPEFVEFAEMEFIARALQEGDTPTHLEIAIGFEAFDDRIRNDVYRKGLSLQSFEHLADQAGPFGYGLKCYFMQKPVPGMTDAEAIEDIQFGIDYLSQIATAHGLRINMHLCPTYVGQGTLLAEAFHKGDYAPPLLRDVAVAARHARGKNVSVFIGLSDEGLAVPGGSFLRPGDEKMVEDLERFNRTQDFVILDGLFEA